MPPAGLPMAQADRSRRRRLRHRLPLRAACLAACACACAAFAIGSGIWGGAGFVEGLPKAPKASRSPDGVAAARARGGAAEEDPFMDEDGIVYARFQGGKMLDVQEDEKPKAKGRPRGDRMPQKEEPKRFIGQVKSFAPQQGYGFIQCDDTFNEFGCDVFLHKNEVQKGLVGKASVGDKVTFKVDLNAQGRPQATDVRRFLDQVEVETTAIFVGTVKRFSADMGYGFIACEETQRKFGGDIFLHKNQAEEAGDLQEGDGVSFTVQVSSRGQAQARNVLRHQPGEATAAVQSDSTSLPGAASDGEAIVGGEMSVEQESGEATAAVSVEQKSD